MTCRLLQLNTLLVAPLLPGHPGLQWHQPAVGGQGDHCSQPYTACTQTKCPVCAKLFIYLRHKDRTDNPSQAPHSCEQAHPQPLWSGANHLAKDPLAYGHAEGVGHGRNTIPKVELEERKCRGILAPFQGTTTMASVIITVVVPHPIIVESIHAHTK